MWKRVESLGEMKINCQVGWALSPRVDRRRGARFEKWRAIKMHSVHYIVREATAREIIIWIIIWIFVLLFFFKQKRSYWRDGFVVINEFYSSRPRGNKRQHSFVFVIEEDKDGEENKRISARKRINVTRIPREFATISRLVSDVRLPRSQFRLFARAGNKKKDSPTTLDTHPSLVAIISSNFKVEDS